MANVFVRHGVNVRREARHEVVARKSVIDIVTLPRYLTCRPHMIPDGHGRSILCSPHQIPKCGSSFFHTYSLYACNIEWHRQSHLVGPSYVGDNKSAGGSIYPGYGPGTLCPRAVPNTFGHYVLRPEEIGGLVVAFFRHPRSRMASHCRAQVGAHHRKNGAKNPNATALYSACIQTNIEQHLSVMTRQVAGESCGGPVRCNSDVPLKKLDPSDSLLERSLDRIRSGVVTFVGLTDNWDESIHLLHRQFLPGVPVFSTELKNEHPSVARTTEDSKAITNIVQQELFFANLKGETASRLANDPDLILYAFARQQFCDNYRKEIPSPHRTSPSANIDVAAGEGFPSECLGTLGVVPAIRPRGQVMAKAVPEGQKNAAAKLLDTWVAHRVKIPKARKALIQITSGGAVLLESSAIDMY